MTDPDLGKSMSLVDLESAWATRDADSFHPHVPFSISTEPVRGGVTDTDVPSDDCMGSLSKEQQPPVSESIHDLAETTSEANAETSAESSVPSEFPRCRSIWFLSPMD